MATQPVTFRLPTEDVKYIEEYAARHGIKKAQLIQHFVEQQLAILREQPMPEKETQEERLTSSTKDTTVEEDSQAPMKSQDNPEPTVSTSHGRLMILKEIAQSLETASKDKASRELDKLLLGALKIAQKTEERINEMETEAWEHRVSREKVRQRLKELPHSQTHEFLQHYKHGEEPEILLRDFPPPPSSEWE